MDTAERKEQREDLRERIVEAARDIVGEHGLDALSMRALAVRIGYSPATIYLHFKDKDEILRGVMEEGFKRLRMTMERELSTLPSTAAGLERYAMTGRAYAKFALENTGYFRAMFKMPRVAHMGGCPQPAVDGICSPEGGPEHGVGLVQEAIESGAMCAPDAGRAALIGWAVMHGLTSLYLSGHLTDHAGSHEEFMELVESAIDALRTGWAPRTELS
ncbi:MAG TPA: TetR/AcrR family transcriptional regulator [Longimicrobiales bacterium]|nr:TetR/AcrR family transcriptional regulator [Longimicrobiales bacterium]